MIFTYFNITVIAEWSAFFAALLLLDGKTSVWRLFKLFLFLTISAETIGWYFNYIAKRFNNSLPFNILMLISVVFFAWLFSTVKQMQKVRAQMYFLIISFILFGVINLFFFQHFWTYNYYTETVGDLIISVTTFYFLLTILKNEEYINLFHYEYFWLATGLLFSSLGSVLLYVFSDALFAYYRDTKIPVYDYLNYILNLVFYVSLIIAFVCRRKTTR